VEWSGLIGSCELAYTVVVEPVDRVVSHGPRVCRCQPVELVVDAVLASGKEMSVAVEDDGDRRVSGTGGDLAR
jgi:hypothetical protein